MTHPCINTLEQLLNYNLDCLGHVAEINGAKLAIISEKSADKLSLTVNDLVLVDSSVINQKLVGFVMQIKSCGSLPTLKSYAADLAVLEAESPLETATKKHSQQNSTVSVLATEQPKQSSGDFISFGQLHDERDTYEPVVIIIMLVGSFYYRLGDRQGVFKTTLSGYPNIGARSYLLTGHLLTLMRRVMDDNLTKESSFVQIGADYGISSGTFMDGNRFFQRHALIAGSTGSGKSWITAYLLERAADLKNANCLLFDLHGEYSSLRGDNFIHFHIAKSGSDPDKDWLEPEWMEDKIRAQSSIPLFLPLWMLPFEELQRIVLGTSRTETSAANQIQLLRQGVSKLKFWYLDKHGLVHQGQDVSSNMPVPFNLQQLHSIYDEIYALNNKDSSTGFWNKFGEKKLPIDTPRRNSLDTLKNRIKSLLEDLDGRFMTCPSSVLQQPEALDRLCTALFDNKIGSVSSGVKIIDCSHLSSKMRDIAIAIICRLALEVQSRVDPADCLPLTLFCDEAHLYMNNEESLNSQRRVFERIAKEGRKYGLSLVVISQRPADISTTVLSQCCNFIIMRLTSSYDQALVRSLLPESMGDFAERLPYFEVGEALLIGDAFMMPSRVKLMEPRLKPLSSTVETWDIWSRGGEDAARPEQHALRITHALNSWRQSFGLPPAKT